MISSASSHIVEERIHCSRTSLYLKVKERRVFHFFNAEKRTESILLREKRRDKISTFLCETALTDHYKEMDGGISWAPAHRAEAGGSQLPDQPGLHMRPCLFVCFGGTGVLAQGLTALTAFPKDSVSNSSTLMAANNSSSKRI